MKTNFFKIVLPAFALMLAITASLAFTPAENSAEDPNETIVDYISNVTTNCVDADLSIGYCNIEQFEDWIPCTVNLGGAEGVVQLRKDQTSCVTLLFMEDL
ncbi:DUF6520 family protein [Flavivirga sp. 57AJ16]|uniref:DUF6520 family protein n=1 Tax=Flavivirga sp. 57AJ16 TaxID=3025307 RepID=UPI0023668E92|nr:DUF6520 family protein [Flavivirga sp. 57AJ16]MDD7888254.1 DUF6520 family protein [Flavivirga sp. 57AJ16]